MTDHTKALARAADELEHAHQARDEAIIVAHNAGMKVAHIATAVKLSRAHVHRIINAAKEPAD